MSRNNASAPDRGQTLYAGNVIDTNNLKGLNLEGQTKEFEDIDWTNPESAKPSRSARKVRCMLVRNFSGVTLYGKRLVTLNPQTNRITGYAVTLAQEAFPLDEFLGTNGVPHGDLCWVVVSGPAIVRTLMTGQTANIAQGDLIVAATVNAASTAAGTTGTPGRPDSINLSALTTAAQGYSVVQHARNAWTALSAATTGQTNTDLLVDVARPLNMV